MKHYINKNSSDSEKFTSVNLVSNAQEKNLLPYNTAQINKELQQEKTPYLNRMLEAYGDCV